jgi:hypothetical protein
MRRAILLLSFLACACDVGFQDEAVVVDLRVLGVRADPAEVIVDSMTSAIPPVTITALVADPGTSRRLEWRMEACAPTLSLRCDDDDPAAVVVPMGTGFADDPEAAVPGASVSAELVLTPELIQWAIAEDSYHGFGGLPIQVSLRLVGEGGGEADAVYAAKNVVYALRDPATRVANQNPTLERLEVRHGEDAYATLEGGPCSDPTVIPHPITAGETVRLSPVEPEGVRETYVLPTFSGGERSFTENMTYAWYVTAGNIGRVTGGPVDAFGNPPILWTDYSAPGVEHLAEIPGGLINLWLVMRDERGGVTWTQRCLVVSE